MTTKAMSVILCLVAAAAPLLLSRPARAGMVITDGKVSLSHTDREHDDGDPSKGEATSVPRDPREELFFLFFASIFKGHDAALSLAGVDPEDPEAEALDWDAVALDLETAGEAEGCAAAGATPLVGSSLLPLLCARRRRRAVRA